MATIGLDRLYYAKITENDAGEETYGTPSQLAKAISADLSVELAEALCRRRCFGDREGIQIRHTLPWH